MLADQDIASVITGGTVATGKCDAAQQAMRDGWHFANEGFRFKSRQSAGTDDV